MKQETVIVTSASGLHARPAGLLVGKAKEFESEVTFTKGEQTISAKSIMGILSLGTSQNDQLVIQTSGSDEDEALSAIVSLFQTVLVHE